MDVVFIALDCDRFVMQQTRTLTACNKSDVPCPCSSLVPGLAADSDLLRMEKHHLAEHLVDLAALVISRVSHNADAF